MPIDSTPTTSKHPIELGLLAILDVDKLAEIIAYVLLGKRYHAQKILAGTPSATLAFSDENIDELIAQVDCPTKVELNKKTGKMQVSSEVIHRDGWLLQIISWIFHKRNSPGAYLKTPHSYPAGKGFDGLLITMDGSSIDHILLFEEKATNAPRSMVSAIWSEFKVYESGSRDNELSAEASTLLELVPGVDVDEITSASDWYNTKKYCATVATSKGKLPTGVELFEGYDGVVPGAADRRIAKLLTLDDLRAYFEDLAQRIIAFAESQRP